MKKLLLLITVVFTLVSCKKEQQIMETFPHKSSLSDEMNNSIDYSTFDFENQSLEQATSLNEFGFNEIIYAQSYLNYFSICDDLVWGTDYSLVTRFEPITEENYFGELEHKMIIDFGFLDHNPLFERQAVSVVKVQVYSIDVDNGIDYDSAEPLLDANIPLEYCCQHISGANIYNLYRERELELDKPYYVKMSFFAACAGGFVTLHEKVFKYVDTNQDY